MRKLFAFGLLAAGCATTGPSERGINPYFVSGAFYLQRQKPAEAARRFYFAVQEEPDNPLYRYFYGLALLEKGDTAMAEAQWKRILEISPGDPAASEALGQLYLAQGRPEKALEVYRALLKFNPAHECLARLGMARAFLALGQVDSSYAQAVQVLTASPFSAEAWFILGVFYAQVGERERAIEVLRKALEIDPSVKFKIEAEPNLRDLRRALYVQEG